MEYIEVTGKSVEEAITNACTKLGIPSDKLDYEVIDKGNSGFLGIFNSKPAKIKAREKQEEPEVNSVETPKKNTSLLIITRMQKLRKHLRLKHSHSLRKSHLQQNRRKLLRRILKNSLIICLVL